MLSSARSRFFRRINHVNPFSAVSRSFSAKKKVKDTIKQDCIISGFSTFSSRYDLDKAIEHNGLVVHDVDRELDSRDLFPTGSWIVKVSLDQNTEVKESHTFSTPLELIRMHLMEKFSRRITVTLASKRKKHTYSNRGNQEDYLTSAKVHDIDECTIRLRNVSRQIGKEELKFFFRDYKLLNSSNSNSLKPPRVIAGKPHSHSFQRLQLVSDKVSINTGNNIIKSYAADASDFSVVGGYSNHKKGSGWGRSHYDEATYNWLVRFDSPADAERAFMNLDGHPIQGMPVQMFLYT